MKTLKFITTVYFVLTFTNLFAQDMKEGFTYLETGKYAEAETFFETILKEYPKNKTARLCYGRAIGLNGKADKANQLFTVLLNDYPNDFEVKLNYGESLLWNNNFADAKIYYKGLVTENSKSFPALLGFANTLSNLKEYEDAIVYVNKALEVLPGNPNALTSKKYIYLGYAYQNQQAQNYDKAESLLNTNRKLFGDDKDILLNLANLYLIKGEPQQAKTLYNTLAKQPDHKMVALNGLSLATHLDGKSKQALQISAAIFDSITPATNAEIAKQTTERYAQALIWNKKFKQATTLIDSLAAKTPKKNWILALRATLNVYKSNFKSSLKDYNTILKNDSTSFDGNLGKANVLKALGQYNAAYASADSTLRFYNNQKDAVNFINTMDISFTPHVDTKVSYTFDNGNNESYVVTTDIEFPLSTNVKLLGHYNYRNTDNSVTQNSAVANNATVGIAYQFLPNITLKTAAGVSSAKAKTNSYAQLLADVSFNIKALKMQTLDVGYTRQIESFNADLLDREIVQNNYYVNYNLSTNVNLGWYTQLIHTAQNDGNTRNLLFTSLYYNLLPKPALKVGFNYQYITFKEQLPTIYFSPKRFNNYELFFNIIKNEDTAKPKSWFYNLTGAYGYQFIEDDPKQASYRIQGEFGYKLSSRSLLNVYGTHSNIAAATAAGFTFTEVGLRFKWTFLKKKMF